MPSIEKVDVLYYAACSQHALRAELEFVRNRQNKLRCSDAAEAERDGYAYCRRCQGRGEFSGYAQCRPDEKLPQQQLEVLGQGVYYPEVLRELKVFAPADFDFNDFKPGPALNNLGRAVAHMVQ